ncbi:TatD family hydrolase [Aliiglaciecola lipolytica]|uniref:TatD DNase family protein n=1 Tax=Aliiglaciecola lipolytica E3 TaxID=1127673 RepID=K6XTW7_9ALTE|nr:TatD family hydrolase [Aliiglaciecola lipolytica]GAC15131.1 TatD DNase family protein [Aliiglaciecola lipolytica E3]
MIDSHCHLDFQAFDADRTQVLNHCLDIGITNIIIPGTQAKSWQALISLCKESPMLEFALGLHPYFLKHSKTDDLDTLSRLIAENPQLVAVGEIGLDFQADDLPKQALQQEFFIQQLQIAQQNSLPVIIHHRRSHNQIIRILKQQKFQFGGVIHAFSGSYQEAKNYLDLGFNLGFGGVITYPRASKTRETLRKIPLESVLLETDSPDMPISGRQGQRNSPEYLPEIVRHIAHIRGEEIDYIKQQTRKNTQRLFGLEGA